jgi:hypothetical protein
MQLRRRRKLPCQRIHKQGTGGGRIVAGTVENCIRKFGIGLMSWAVTMINVSDRIQYAEPSSYMNRDVNLLECLKRPIH